MFTAHRRFEWAFLLLRHFPSHINAVEESLDFLRDLHEGEYWSQLDGRLLSRITQLVPALYIRLGKDQEALDFVKRWAVERSGGWSDGTASPIGASEADDFEYPGSWFRTRSGLSVGHLAAVILIKIRLLFDIQALSTLTTLLRGTFSQEIIDLIYTELVGPDFSSRNIPMNDTPYLSLVAQMAKRQIFLLVETPSLSLASLRVWHQLLGQLGLAVAVVRPLHGAPDEEEPIWIQHISQSWKETSGAVELLKEVVTAVGRIGTNGR